MNKKGLENLILTRHIEDQMLHVISGLLWSISNSSRSTPHCINRHNQQQTSFFIVCFILREHCRHCVLEEADKRERENGCQQVGQLTLLIICMACLPNQRNLEQEYLDIRTLDLSTATTELLFSHIFQSYIKTYTKTIHHCHHLNSVWAIRVLTSMRRSRIIFAINYFAIFIEPTHSVSQKGKTKQQVTYLTNMDRETSITKVEKKRYH